MFAEYKVATDVVRNAAAARSLLGRDRKRPWSLQIRA